MTMHVIDLRVKNVKGIIEAHINSDGEHVVEVVGKNRQGKTSVLDAIWAGLRGADFSRESTVPLREGEARGSVRLDLGEVIVTRTWKRGGPKAGVLVLTTAKGTPIEGPQGYLDNLLGRFALNLDAFARLDKKEQVDTLLGLVDLPYNPYELEQERDGVFVARRDTKRERDALAARLAALPDLPADAPKTKVSASELLAELEDIRGHNAAIDEEEEKLALAEGEHASADLALSEAEEAVQAAQTALALAKEDRQRKVGWRNSAATAHDAQAAHVATLERKEDGPVRARIETVDEQNALVEQREAQAALLREHDEKQQLVDDLDERLEKIDQAKRDGLAAAQLPIDGLAFDEDGISLHGTSWRDLSGSERVLVSASIAIAQNPTIRILRIDRGEELDRDTIEQLRALAVEKDYQLWISRVANDGDEYGDVRIVDGRVADNEETAA
jgi:hypothetical protein